MPETSILLVEDNSDHEFLIRSELPKQNFVNRIVAVWDGAEALDYLFGTGSYADRDPNATPTLVMLDLKLPKIDGLEVLRRIRADERTKALPVVVMTSSDEERDVAESYSRGASIFVRKSANFGEFREAVRQVGLYWSLINEPPPKPGT